MKSVLSDFTTTAIEHPVWELAFRKRSQNVIKFGESAAYRATEHLHEKFPSRAFMNFGVFSSPQP
jgi:hypothetical protein